MINGGIRKLVVGVILSLVMILVISAVVDTAAAAERPIRIFMDGEELVFDMAPVEIDGRTLVPMRPIFEALQADISWDHARQTVTAVKDGKEIIIVRDSFITWINGEAFHLDVSARTMNDRMMVPVRFISEALDVAVQWTELERRVDLFTDNNGQITQGQEEAGNNSQTPSGNGNGSSDGEAEYPQRIIGTKPVTGKLAFGTQAPRGISFTASESFLDTQPAIFYNIILEFDDQWQKEFLQDQAEDTYALEIRTYLWGPDQTLLVERKETDAQIRSDAKEFRTHDSVRLTDLIDDHRDIDGSWFKGLYRMAVEVNGRQVFVEDFSVVEAINSIGNTSGNLYNHGLAARQGDFIYYVGPDGGLYRKTIRDTDIVKLTSDQVEYLNVQGQWIYFVNRSKDGVISRIRFDGRVGTSDEYPYYYNYRGETETLSHDASGQLLLVDDWLYYINLSDKRKLYRMKTDGSQQEMVLDQPLQQFYLQDQYYMHGKYIVYMTFDEKFSDWADNTNKKRDEKARRVEEDYQLAVGHLYMTDLDGGSAKKMAEEPIIGMVVANQSVYCLTPKRNASWEAQISGRVPGNLYKIAIPKSLADISEVTLSEEEMLAEEVMNFYVDVDWLMLQTNPNRGNAVQKYTVDGEFVEELDMKIGRKRTNILNRTTFPVTFMNGAYEWIYYYAGDENERVTDAMPLRNDRYRSVKENSIRELKAIEDDYYWR